MNILIVGIGTFFGIVAFAQAAEIKGVKSRNVVLLWGILGGVFGWLFTAIVVIPLIPK